MASVWFKHSTAIVTAPFHTSPNSHVSTNQYEQIILRWNIINQIPPHQPEICLITTSLVQSVGSVRNNEYSCFAYTRQLGAHGYYTLIHDSEAYTELRRIGFLPARPTPCRLCLAALSSCPEKNTWNPYAQKVFLPDIRVSCRPTKSQSSHSPFATTYSSCPYPFFLVTDRVRTL